MLQIETTNGSRKVISTSNGIGRPWTSRLYVNHGENATMVTAKHKTQAGALNWAKAKLA